MGKFRRDDSGPFLASAITPLERKPITCSALTTTRICQAGLCQHGNTCIHATKKVKKPRAIPEVAALLQQYHLSSFYYTSVNLQ